MTQTRQIQTNFSKGEIDPLLEGRPDLVAFKEGVRQADNFILLRQAGLSRRPGTRFVAEVKDSNLATILIPFEAGLSNPIIIEIGHQYMRFYKDNIRLESSPGIPVEITSPYNDTNLQAIHYTQSVDVLFLFQRLFRQRRLNRISDLNYSLVDITHRPPPSFEADTDVSDSTFTLEPGGGQGVNTPPNIQPGGGGVDGNGDTGSDGGDGGGGDGGGE